MGKALRDYPWIKLVWGEIVCECATMPGDEFKLQFFNAYRSWLADRYDDLPQWAKSAADRAREKSVIYAANGEKKGSNSKAIAEQLRSNSEQLSISSPLFSSELGEQQQVNVQKKYKYPWEADNLFMQFWTEYPKKTAPAAAYKSWLKIKYKPATLNLIIEALKWQSKLPGWLKDNGQFIPMPATYLNQCRWQDERVLNEWEKYDRDVAAGKITGTV
jgi:hypothetical protein